MDSKEQESQEPQEPQEKEPQEQEPPPPPPPKEPKKPKKRIPRPKKPEPKPIDQLIHPLPVVHQPSIIPTHIEEDLEDVPIDGYDIEEVIVRRFVHQETTYFRESTKNKLYLCVKGTIGPYVGRYDPLTDAVVTEVPDSDDEEPSGDEA